MTQRLFWHPRHLLLLASLIAFWATKLSFAQIEDSPSIDQLIERIQSRLSACDSAWTDMTMIATTHERKLNNDGTIKEETTRRTRLHRRGEQVREFLEAVWKNGEAVTGKDLASAIDKHNKQQRKQYEKRKKAKEEGEEDKSHQQEQRLLEPFWTETTDAYTFSVAAFDTMDGNPAWAIAVEPVDPSDEQVSGTVWIDTSTYSPLLEDYTFPEPPGPVKEMSMLVKYDKADRTARFWIDFLCTPGARP